MTKIPPSNCPSCNAFINGASPAKTNDASEPSNGDFTVCIYCAGLAVYNEDLTLRKPSEEEMKIAASNTEIIKMKYVVRQVIAMKEAEDIAQRN